MTKIGCIQEAARAVVLPNLGLPAVYGWVGAVTLATKISSPIAKRSRGTGLSKP